MLWVVASCKGTVPRSGKEQGNNKWFIYFFSGRLLCCFLWSDCLWLRKEFTWFVFAIVVWDFHGDGVWLKKTLLISSPSSLFLPLLIIILLPHHTPHIPFIFSLHFILALVWSSNLLSVQLHIPGEQRCSPHFLLICCLSVFMAQLSFFLCSCNVS